LPGAAIQNMLSLDLYQNTVIYPLSKVSLVPFNVPAPVSWTYYYNMYEDMAVFNLPVFNQMFPQQLVVASIISEK
jgi:hypothetical protein